MSATISACGKYRFRLDRTVNPSLAGRVLFIGINPSTADAVRDDPTVRKWKGFVRRWGDNGYGHFTVGNVFAYRSDDPRVLKDVDDPVGPDNFETLKYLVTTCDIIVPCWGRVNKVPKNLRGEFEKVMGLLAGCGKPVYVFGMTKCGNPKHPLMLAYDTHMIARGNVL